MKLLILADDFTGAMDTGVQLSKENISTLVLPHIPEDFPPEDSCQVLVINTGLRHASYENAYEVTANLIQALYHPGLHIYIKTDSALRGNINACLSAACHTLQRPVHFIPAFPDAGRTARNSTVYINGELLEQSVFAKDPRSPMTKSHIPDILGDTKGLPVTAAAASCQPQDFSSPAIYLYDGETNKDLARIGIFLKENNQLTLTAGCAGFATQFPKLLDFKKDKPYTPDAHTPVLFVSGSANAVTFRQLARAKELGYPLISMSGYLTASFSREQTYKEQAKALEDQLVTTALCYLQKGICPILATAAGNDDLFDLEKAKDAVGSEERVHQVIQNCCAALTKRILDSASVCNLAVFGGDTVASILEILSCNLVEAKGQLGTGVPLCLLEYQNRTLHLVTKSGGLGDDSIVKIIADYFYANYE